MADRVWRVVTGTLILVLLVGCGGGGGAEGSKPSATAPERLALESALPGSAVADQAPLTVEKYVEVSGGLEGVRATLVRNRYRRGFYRAFVDQAQGKVVFSFVLEFPDDEQARAAYRDLSRFTADNMKVTGHFSVPDIPGARGETGTVDQQGVRFYLHSIGFVRKGRIYEVDVLYPQPDAPTDEARSLAKRQETRADLLG